MSFIFANNNEKIPYSEILKYLTNIQKRHFQSLNHHSKKLLLANIDAAKASL
jgi:hypothetical protein